MQSLKNKSKDDKEDSLTLGDQFHHILEAKYVHFNQTHFLKIRPVKIKCSYCAANQKTEVRFKNGVISYTLCFLAFITLPFLISIIAIPIILLLTKNLVHVCSCCDNQVGSDGKIIYALKFQDDVVTIKLGEMGFILTRKLVITIILIALCILVLIYKINNSMQHSHHHKYGHSHSHDQIYPIESSWKEFYDECNLKYLFSQGQASMSHCYHKYIDRTVQNWDGYIIRVEDLRGTLKQFIHHAVTILIQMDPTEQTEEQKFPDLQLTFDSEVADKYSNFLDEINRGNRIGFNATIKSIGFEGQTRHLHVNQIWKMEGHKEIEAHVHHGGRYKDLGKNFRKSKDLVPVVFDNAGEDQDKVNEENQQNEQQNENNQQEQTQQENKQSET